LVFARVIEPIGLAIQPHDPMERERRDAPDMLIILGDEMIVCEAKFF
jgi:hypothetical protein